jgi:hypothetical protein
MSLFVSGFDWDPAVPYYSQRSCLMDIHNLSRPLPLRQEIERNRDGLAAIVLCGKMRGRIREVKDTLGLDGFSEIPVYADDFGELYLLAGQKPLG